MPKPLVKTKHPGIYKRGGRYAVIYRDAEGRQRQQSARTLDEARNLKSARTADVKRGEFHPDSRTKFSDYAAGWVERYRGRGSRGFRENTRDEYRRDLNRYAISFFGRRHMTEITPREVDAFIGWLCDDEAQRKRHRSEAADRKRDGQSKLGKPRLPLADTTVRRILSPVRACMGSAAREGVVRHNPTVGATLPARDHVLAIEAGTDRKQEPVRVLTDAQLVGVLTVTPARWQTLFSLIAATGLRISEAFALRWCDIELNGSSPHVSVSRAYVRGRFGPPKSKKGYRDVPIDFDLVRELRERRSASEWRSDDDLVFCALNGEPLRQENVRRRGLEIASAEAGVPWIGFHTFRHTCAVRLHKQGRGIVEIQHWLGHHSPSFTLNVYVGHFDGEIGAPLASSLRVSDVSAQATETTRNDDLALVA